VSDEPEADRDDPRPEEASRGALYRRRLKDRREIRQQPVDQDHQDDGGRCRSDDRPLCACRLSAGSRASRRFSNLISIASRKSKFCDIVLFG